MNINFASCLQHFLNLKHFPTIYIFSPSFLRFNRQTDKLAKNVGSIEKSIITQPSKRKMEKYMFVYHKNI